MRDNYVVWRQSLLKEWGGLPPPEVKNKEWLYLLKNETRNSIMIEGIFVKEEELEAIISGNNCEIRSATDVLSYFRTAKFLYGLGYENFLSNELIFTRGLIMQVNKGIEVLLSSCPQNAKRRRTCNLEMLNLMLSITCSK